MRLIVRQGIKLNYLADGLSPAVKWQVKKWLTKKAINNCSTLGRSPVASKFLTFLAMGLQLVLHGD